MTTWGDLLNLLDVSIRRLNFSLFERTTRGLTGIEENDRVLVDAIYEVTALATKIAEDIAKNPERAERDAITERTLIDFLARIDLDLSGRRDGETLDDTVLARLAREAKDVRKSLGA